MAIPTWDSSKWNPQEDPLMSGFLSGAGDVKVSNGTLLIPVKDGHYLAQFSEPTGQEGMGWVGLISPEGEMVGEPRMAPIYGGSGFNKFMRDTFGGPKALLAPLAAWAAGSALGLGAEGATGALSASELAAADMALGGVGGTAGAEALGTALAQAGVPATLAEGIKTAVTDAVSQGTPFGTAVKDVLSSVMNLPGIGTAVKGLIGSLLTGDNLSKLLGGGLQIAGGIDAINDMRDLSQTAATDLQNAGNEQAGALTGLGTTARTDLTNLGATARTDLTNLGTGVRDDLNAIGSGLKTDYGMLSSAQGDRWSGLGEKANTTYRDIGTAGQSMFTGLGNDLSGRYSSLAGDVYGKYSGIADQAKGMAGEFKPYSLTTNLGSTDDKGNFKLNAPNQAVNDLATGVANKSFSAADAFDLDNIREQEYGLMQDIYRPEDERDRLGLESRMAKQGRLGLQSFSSANSVTDPTGTYGAAPELVALYQGQKRRNLESFLTADDSAMKRRGGLIDQGNAAMQTPFNYNTAGLNMLTTGANIGQQDFNARLAGAELWSGLAGRGVDQYANIGTQGLGAYGDAMTSGIRTNIDNQQRGAAGMLGAEEAGIRDRTRLDEKAITEPARLAETGVTSAADLEKAGITAGTNLEKAGIEAGTDLSAEGIRAKYNAVKESIKVRMGGEQNALNALVSMYRSLGGSVASMTGKTFDEALSGIAEWLGDSAGITPTEALTMIEGWFGSSSDQSGENYL